MTLQEIFDKVWDHFVVQKGPPSRRAGSVCCSYRNDDGAKCAIGVLIPDEMYTADMECGWVAKLLRNFPEVAKLLGDPDEKFIGSLTTLQYAHDDASTDALYDKGPFHELIEQYLRSAARLMNVEVPNKKG